MSDEEEKDKNSESGELGRIRPKKVEKELTPLEREALKKQQEQYYAGEVVSDLDSLVQQVGKSKVETPTQAPTSNPAGYAEDFVGDLQETSDVPPDIELAQEVAERSRAKVGTFIVLGLGMICAIWILVWVLPLISRKMELEKQQEAVSQYSHLEVRQKAEEKLDLTGALGVLRINEGVFGLRVVEARLFRNASTVEISFYENESVAEPIIKVILKFEPGTQNANPENLKEYTVMRALGDKPFIFKKEYIRRLASHEEISELGGKLEDSSTFRAAMKDARVDSSGSQKVEWDFRFESLLSEITETPVS